MLSIHSKRKGDPAISPRLSKKAASFHDGDVINID
jgi:hypothetical protein